MHTIEGALAGLTLNKSGVPVYVQLRDHLADAIKRGILTPGAQIPTMRQVAVLLRVDINTVRHAYDDLERLGLITLERGRGSFVAGTPGSGTVLSETDRLAQQSITAARLAGVDPRTLAQRILALTAEGDSP